MICKKEDLHIRTWKNVQDETAYTLTDLTAFDEKNPKLRLYSHVRVQPGEEVSYHTHQNESESYYILEGKALYRDNDEETIIGPGTVTLTTSGNGHAIKNIGCSTLEFIAVILLD